MPSESSMDTYVFDGHCSRCYCKVVPEEVNTLGECGVCQALSSLRRTLIKRGIMHPDLFEEGQKTKVHNDP